MFLETPRFPDNIAYGCSGGPNYSTDVVELNSGFEQRNANWAESRGEWDVSQGLKNPADMQDLLNFFRICQGKAHGFRFKDFLDYQVSHTTGLLGSSTLGYGLGYGLPTYSLWKLYASGSATQIRAVKKPVSVAVMRGGMPVNPGGGAGNIAVDLTTGLITFIADAASAATTITAGATTVVVLSTNPGTLIAGQQVYLSGFTGADAALVNNQAHLINTLSGSGPYTFTLATNTSGKTITLGSGTGKKYPQATETLTWAGEFDTPCRFDDDRMKLSVDSYERYTWGNILIKEVRV